MTACKHKVSGTLSLPSRGAFHLSLTVLLRVTRVRRYSGSPLLGIAFGYVALTLSRRPSHAVLLAIPSRDAGPNPGNIATAGLASSAFARHY